MSPPISPSLADARKTLHRTSQRGRGQQQLLRASAVQEAEAPSWGPVTELWTKKSKTDYDSLQARFRAADIDGNGVIDREELRALLESTDSGSQYSLTHWLEDDDLDKVMRNYDENGDGVIQFEEFCKLAQDNVLFSGKIEEYEAAFNLVDTDKKGSVGPTQLAQLFTNLGNPLPYDRLSAIMRQYDVSKKGQLTFNDVMKMFRDELLDLNEILNYIKLAPDDSAAATSVEAPAKTQPGEILEIESEEELDNILQERKDTLIVLLGSLTWCRPCKTLAKPLQNLAEYYKEAGFLKTYGNVSEAAKYLFKERLKARVTPTFYFFRNGELVHTHTGANKVKLEYYIRECLEPKERPEQALFPPGSGPAGNWR
ncbi:g7094 [Coccomyxa viridis]|uniref:G7094 protein n=1 Tax=Coccomyxa viridis TaxID=1274662 RepID=A0ABP1G3K2_9CHLO